MLTALGHLPSVEPFFKPSECLTMADGRFLIIRLQLQSEIVALINVYAPTQSELKKQLVFIDTLDPLISDIDAHNIFMGGDFNVHLDKLPSTPSSQEQP